MNPKVVRFLILWDGFKRRILKKQAFEILKQKNLQGFENLEGLSNRPRL